MTTSCTGRCLTLGTKITKQRYVVLVFLLSLPIVGLAEPATSCEKFQPTDEKVIVTHGWNKDELQGIIHDFMMKYPDTMGAIARLSIDLSCGYLYRLHFSNSLDDEKFFYLINYLQYPERYESESRKIWIVGFSLPSLPRIGQSELLAIFVPSKDVKFDVVYGCNFKLESCYSYSFQHAGWEAVSDGRVPQNIRDYLKAIDF